MVMSAACVIWSSTGTPSTSRGTPGSRIPVRRMRSIVLFTFITMANCFEFEVDLNYIGARGAVVVKALATNRQVAVSIPDGVTGNFQ